VNEPSAPLNVARRALADRLVIQVRADAALPVDKAILHSRANTVLAVDAQRNEDAPSDAGIGWKEPRVSILRAHPQLLASWVVADVPSTVPAVSRQSLIAELASAADSNAKRTPMTMRDGELLLLEQQVAALLLSENHQSFSQGELRLKWAQRMASLFGLTLRSVEHLSATESPAWLLTPDGGPRLTDAAFLLRERGTGLGLEVPDPLGEPGTLALAAELWNAADARALVFKIVEASDNSLLTSYHAFHQAAHRALTQPSSVMASIRGFSSRPGLKGEVLVEMSGPLLSTASPPEHIKQLFETEGVLAQYAPYVTYHDGSMALAGLIDASPQRTFSRTFGGAAPIALWFSENIRGAYRFAPRTDDQLNALRLTRPLGARDPMEALTSRIAPSKSAVSAALKQRFKDMAETAQRVLEQQGVHDFSALMRKNGARVYYSPAHAQPYLWLEARQGRQTLRGIYFLQQELSPIAPVALRADDPALHSRMQTALRYRTPVIVEGQLTTSEAHP
jgi:gamma-polyglutamate biosynthesis protein CapC